MFTPRTGQSGRTETPLVAGQFPAAALPCAPASAERPLWPCLPHNITPHWGEGSRPRGELNCEGHRQLRPKVASAQGRDSCYWHLYRQHIRSRLPQPAPRPMLSTHTSPPCSSTIYSPLGEGADAGRRESTYLKGMESAQTGSSGLLLQQPGAQACP